MDVISAVKADYEEMIKNEPSKTSEFNSKLEIDCWNLLEMFDIRDEAESRIFQVAIDKLGRLLPAG